MWMLCILKSIIANTKISQIFINISYLKKIFAFIQSIYCGEENLKELEKQ